MKLQALRCPNCNGSLDIEDGIDTFYCKYCGYKIIIDGQSGVLLRAKVDMKKMEHEERLLDKQLAQERYKIESKKATDKDNDRSLNRSIVMLVIIVLIAFSVVFVGNKGAEEQERKLQATVAEIMVDIDRRAYEEAYIKANSLYWNDSWTDDGEAKWNATREALLKMIEEAKKEGN